MVKGCVMTGAIHRFLVVVFNEAKQAKGVGE